MEQLRIEKEKSDREARKKLEDEKKKREDAETRYTLYFLYFFLENYSVRSFRQKTLEKELKKLELVAQKKKDLWAERSRAGERIRSNANRGSKVIKSKLLHNL